MATQTITLTEATPDERGVQITVDSDVPVPAFVEFVDSGSILHRYLPASELESERALNAELVEMLRKVYSAMRTGWDSFQLDRDVAALIAKAEAREKGDG